MLSYIDICYEEYNSMGIKGILQDFCKEKPFYFIIKYKKLIYKNLSLKSEIFY